MATYWVPDLPDIKSFASHLWHSILIFANDSFNIHMIQQAYKYVRSSLWPFHMFFEHKITKNNEIRLGRLEKSELPWEPNFFIAVGVLPLELLPYQVSMVSTKTLNISGINADILKL